MRVGDASQQSYADHRLKTPDGSWIAYHRSGSGPVVILVHGLMEAAHSHSDLIGLLSAQFTVVAPDRRGRGASGPRHGDNPFSEDVNDLLALKNHVDAAALFGISIGGLIVLEAASRCPVTATAVFEPPLSIHGSVPLQWLDRFKSELEANDRIAALVTAMLGTQMAPPFMQFIPRTLLKLMTRKFAAKDASNAPHRASMFELASTIEDDLSIVRATADKLESYRHLSRLLLLGGARSPQYFQTALEALAETVPGAQRITFTGIGHGACSNAAVGGKPMRVAQRLATFLANSRSL